jgi:hypothetical protein
MKTRTRRHEFVRVTGAIGIGNTKSCRPRSFEVQLAHSTGQRSVVFVFSLVNAEPDWNLAVSCAAWHPAGEGTEMSFRVRLVNDQSPGSGENLQNFEFD